MMEFILAIIMGLVCIVMGVINTQGNLYFLHSYHKNRVAEEDKLPFGKRVGAGMIICGLGMVFFGGLSMVAYYTKEDIYNSIAMIVLIIFLLVGVVISLLAIHKYNKGIF